MPSRARLIALVLLLSTAPALIASARAQGQSGQPPATTPSSQSAGTRSGTVPPANAPPPDSGSPSGARQSRPGAGPDGSMPPQRVAKPVYPPANTGAPNGAGRQPQ